jgi:uncharacterized protein
LVANAPIGESAMDEFSWKTIKKLEHYVYALIDPRKKASNLSRYFYIGKGQGNRCFRHAYDALSWRKSKDEPNRKLDTIRDILRKTGKPPRVSIVCHGLDRDTAHRIEAILIRLLETGEVQGHNASDYWLSAKDVDGRYLKPIRESELPGKFLIVSLNGGKTLPPFPRIPLSELKGRTVGHWRVLEDKAREVDFVAGIYKQRITCIYRIRKRKDGSAVYLREFWCKTKKGVRVYRTVFRGQRCPEVEQRFESRQIVDSYGNTISKFGPQQSCKIVGRRLK